MEKKWLDLQSIFSLLINILTENNFLGRNLATGNPYYSSVKQCRHLIRASLSGALSRKTLSCVCSSAAWAGRCVEMVMVRWGSEADKSRGGCTPRHSHNLGEVTCLLTRRWLRSRHVLGTVLCLEKYLRIKSPRLLPYRAYHLVRKCNSPKPRLRNWSRPVRRKDLWFGLLVLFLVWKDNKLAENRLLGVHLNGLHIFSISPLQSVLHFNTK